MFVSYSVTGPKKDTACLSLFEFDEHSSQINPTNFMMIMQRITKSTIGSFSSANSQGSTNVFGGQTSSSAGGGNTQNQMPPPNHFDLFREHRMLSAVAEDLDGEDVGSFSIKAHKVLLLQAFGNKAKIPAFGLEEVKSKEPVDGTVDEQDALMF